MAKTKTIPWDSAAYLKTDRDIAHYPEAVFEDGDPALISHALGVIARTKGMSQVAQKAGRRLAAVRPLWRPARRQFLTTSTEHLA
jgi:probable addiction module antidote protein